jgi:hypothetical protein
MKYLKTFEMHSDTGLDDGVGEVIPDYNPDMNKKITDYIEDLAGRGAWEEIAKITKMDIPKNITSREMDEKGDEIKDKAIKHLIENPELLPQEIGFKTYKVPGGDGISRTNKLGGVWGQTR